MLLRISSRHLNTYCQLRQAVKQENIMNIFDRRAKNIQRERAALSADVEKYDFLKEEFGYRLADRVLDISREMSTCVDIGCGRGYVTRHLTGHSIKNLKCLEMSETMLEQCQLPPKEENVQCEKIVFNEDNQKLPFDNESVDIVTSSLALHWVNNLPGLFKEVMRILRKDGVFIGSMFGGDTLFELRGSLQLAELEREGGLGSHISPFVDVQDLGNLLNRSGFNMLTIDSDEIVIRYPTVLQLMRDLKGMAENNASWTRKIRINKDSLLASNAIYENLYGLSDEEGVPYLPATFQVHFWIGWKPHPNQPKPLDPQKGQVSLKDLHQLESVLKHPKD